MTALERIIAAETTIQATDTVAETASIAETITSDPHLYRLSVTEYLAILESGALANAEHIELLDGWMVQKMTKNPRHAFSARRLAAVLSSMLPAGYLFLKEDPLLLSTSIPEPDGAIVRGSEDTFQPRHPNPDEVSLIIEVSDSTLQYDRTAKYRLYAAARIPEYWIVNLNNSTLEVYTEPDGVEDYRQKRTYTSDQSVSLRLEGVEIAAIEVWKFFRMGK